MKTWKAYIAGYIALMHRDPSWKMYIAVYFVTMHGGPKLGNVKYITVYFSHRSNLENVHWLMLCSYAWRPTTWKTYITVYFALINGYLQPWKMYININTVYFALIHGDPQSRKIGLVLVCTLPYTTTFTYFAWRFTIWETYITIVARHFHYARTLEIHIK